MPKPRTESGEKNLISKRLIKLRQKHHMSQRDLANKLQLAGYDMAEIFHVSYVYLLDGEED